MAYSRIDFARIGGFDLNASIVQFLDVLKERAAPLCRISTDRQ